MANLCQCGCGGEIPWQKHHRQRPPRFLHGHNSRTAAHAADKAAVRMTPPDGWVPPSGLCECGCGLPTPIATHTRPEIGHYLGFPGRFIRGHNPRGKRAHGWKGGRKRDVHGYWWIYRPDHPNTTSAGYVREHRSVWEETNGRLLRPDEDVHHIDGDRGNNDPSNLVALTKKQHVDLHASSKETCDKRAAAARRRYLDRDEREESSRNAKRRFASPAERQKHSQRMKAWWAERKQRSIGPGT